MGNEKYVNYYIETLSNTVTDAFLKNISMQANAKVTDDVIKELSKKVDELNIICANQNSEIEELKNKNLQNENEIIKELQNRVGVQQNTISGLNNEINNLNRIKSEYDVLKTQSNNAETFRTQLVKEREAHQQTKDSYESKLVELKQRIEILETPPKRNKAVKSAVVKQPATIDKSDVVKDGGSF